MADRSDARSVSATLVGVAADKVTMLQAWPSIVVTNASTTQSLWVRQDGITAVAEAAGATRVLPSSARVLPSDIDNNQVVISVVGDGNPYTVEGLNTVWGGNLLATALDRDNHINFQAISTVTGLQTALDGKAPKTVAISTQAADYTLALGDAGSEVEGTKATAQTITIPPNSTVAFPVGTVINIRQMGAGQITVAAGVGVTLRAPRGAKTAVLYATVSLVKRAADEWVLAGDAAA